MDGPAPREKIDAEVYGCCGSENCLKHHIVAHHRRKIADTCGLEALRTESYDYYCEAVALRERDKMPAVGISIDRRTLKHASAALQASNPSSLICACCQCVFTCLDGVHAEIARVRPSPYFDSLTAT